MDSWLDGPVQPFSTRNVGLDRSSDTTRATMLLTTAKTVTTVTTTGDDGADGDVDGRRQWNDPSFERLID